MSGGSYSDTPERASGSADVPATGVVEDKVLEERRNAITKSLANAGHNLGFDKLLRLLKLNADYATFGTSMRQKIADLVEQAPAVVDRKIYSTRPARHSSEGDPTYEFGSPQPLTEKALVSCFAPLLEKMICSSDDGSQIMPQRYTVNDHHEFADMGTIIKPGGVVCYRHHGLPGFKSAHIALEAKVSQCDGQAPAKHLGQMGDYALHIWDAQPTRTFVPELAAKWLFDFESVIENKDKHDLITGAPLFMSTRVLLSSKRRGIFDDLKSLLYVVLYALWKVEPALVGTPDGFLHFSDQSMVLAQIACFMDNSIYLKMFGVRDCHVNLSELLDKLYQLVCYEGSTFIPGEQLEDSKFERTPDRSLLKEIGSGGSPDLKRKAMIR
ncbi:hypothetical protein IWW51_003546, partial [Coemansia sp. RSA 2702]